MAKLNPLSALKEAAAQMLGVRRNLQSDLSATRKKIASLEHEYETINQSTLGRADLLEASLLNIDNLHNQLVNKMRGRILITAERTAERANYDNGAVTRFLYSVSKGGSHDYMFGRVTGFDGSKPHELALLYSHEEIKSALRSAFEGISDSEWPDCSPLTGPDALKRLAEIESQLAELRQHESELVTAADREGIDIGQGSSH